MVRIKKQRTGRAIVIVFALSLWVIVFSCKNHKITEEPKYSEHSTYFEFINFLKNRTDTLGNDFEKVCFIRQKVAELIDAGLGTKDVRILDTNWALWSGERYYSVFYSDSATVSCGGSAYFLNAVYISMGFISTTYDMGCSNNFATHQVTLVQLPTDIEYYVQDAYLNTSFSYEYDIMPLTFNDMLDLLAQRRAGDIRIVQGEYNYEPTWDTTGFKFFVKNQKYMEEFLQTIKKEYATEYLYRTYKLMNITNKYKGNYSECLKNYNLPEDIIYLYLIPQKENSNEVLNIVEASVNKSKEKQE